MPEPPEVTAHLAWLAQRGLAATTIYNRRRILARLAAALPVPLLDATPAMLAGWRAGMEHAPGVVCNYVSHVSRFYAWAVAEDLAPVNPAARLPVPRRPRRLPRPISSGDLIRSVTGAPRRIRPWLVLAAWAGLRAKEIALLRAECLILSGPPVVLIAADATKGTRERAVPLCTFAVAELRAAGVPARGWVFRRYDGRPGPVPPHVVSHLANAHLRSLEITATLHQCRHWFASQIYLETKDLRLVQELLGHQDPATTAGYAAYDQQSAARAVDSLPVPGPLRLVKGSAS